MRRISFGRAAGLLVFTALLFVPAAARAEARYVLPAEIQAHRFRFDLGSVSGAVVLADFSVDDTGAPRDLAVRSGAAPFDGVAASILNGWKFTLPPDAAADARVPVMLLFRQPQLLATEPTVRTLTLTDYPPGETPPQPRHIVEPSQPPQVASDGVAILSVFVDSHGKVSGVSPLFGSKEFVAAAQEVVRNWTFQPAQRQGEPVAGGLLLVVYFPQPTL